MQNKSLDNSRCVFLCSNHIIQWTSRKNGVILFACLFIWPATTKFFIWFGYLFWLFVKNKSEKMHALFSVFSLFSICFSLAVFDDRGKIKNKKSKPNPSPNWIFFFCWSPIIMMIINDYCWSSWWLFLILKFLISRKKCPCQNQKTTTTAKTYWWWYYSI